MGRFCLSIIAVVTALEKPRNKVSVKIWLMVAIIVLFCAASYIFQPGEFVSGLSYGERLSALYWGRVDRVGSGLFGGLLGADGRRAQAAWARKFSSCCCFSWPS